MGRSLRNKELFAKLGCSPATGYRIMKDPTFPKAMRVGLRMCVHDEAEIEAWMQSKKGLPVTPAVAPEVKRGRKKKEAGV